MEAPSGVNRLNQDLDENQEERPVTAREDIVDAVGFQEGQQEETVDTTKRAVVKAKESDWKQPPQINDRVFRRLYHDFHNIVAAYHQIFAPVQQQDGANVPVQEKHSHQRDEIDGDQCGNGKGHLEEE